MSKIAFVIQDLVGQGVQFATATMARAFASHGFDVDLVVSKVHDDLVSLGQKPFHVPECVRWIHLPCRRSSRNVIPLMKYLKNGGADWVVAESIHYAWVLRIAGIMVRRCPRLVFIEHLNAPEIPRDPLKRFVFFSIKAFLFKGFSAIMTVNETSRERIEKHIRWLKNPPRVSAVYNAVVDDDFLVKSKEPTTHPWLINKKCPTFVAAGSLHEVKGHAMLLEAFRRVNEATPVRLIIFGRGGLEHVYKEFVLKHRLEDKISIAGFSDNLPAELKGADGFISSSVSESFSIVLGQALALGIPCISTDAPFGPREVLMNGKYGILVPVGDVNAMVTAIRNFIENPPRKPDDESWQRYTIEAIYNRYLQAMNLSE